MALLPSETIAPSGDESVYFRDVFGWMACGLLITAGVSAAIGHSSAEMHALFDTSGGKALFFGAFIVELILVVSLASLTRHMGALEAGALFVVYAALNGLTFSVIFTLYTTRSIFSTFLVTAAMFAALALWGAVTKADLTGWGSFLFMALFGQLIGLVVNLFWLNSELYWVTTATGVLLFSALTAYDVQKLKSYEPPPGSDTGAVEKQAIVGALALYLDFVNLFLYLLRLLGGSRK
jgi:FtsH-binding integral membrane protein